ncbi:MAG: GAF domain-containing sensor histidine kinase, partial [Anaerolineaceae bacterium]|nr:GAF domain-containing sensor histidine kinase [Anaerolineaceae bacterium]
VERSIAGWVYSNNQPMSLHHADKDDRIYRVVDRELSEGTHSILAVPLTYRGNTIGVFETINKSNDSYYTDEDVKVIEVLASQVAIAVHNRNLLEEVRRAGQKVVELEQQKSDFIAITSHELRTPLGLVIGHSTFLAETASEEQRRDVDVIVRNAMRLKEVIEQLSNSDVLEQGFHRMRKGKVSISAIIQDCVNAYQLSANEKHITIVMDIKTTPLVVEGDAGKLEMVVGNLLKNAITFTNQNGHVKITADQVPGYVKISINDNGIGIPSDEQEKIFQRFYQVEKHLTRHHGGMGLGLSIAKEMVEMHGGRIWVESVEGKGSKFMFILPSNSAQVAGAKTVFKT